MHGAGHAALSMNQADFATWWHRNIEAGVWCCLVEEISNRWKGAQVNHFGGTDLVEYQYRSRPLCLKGSFGQLCSVLCHRLWPDHQ